jgi:hypothetical protein
MVHVTGKYCPRVRHRCINWLDDPELPYARCGSYEKLAECLAPRIPLNFCIDREEYTPTGETLPENYLSLNLGAQRCASQNKRLCLEKEWNFACEGEEMRPYPYGWSREPQCHQDRTDLYEMRDGKQVLRDLRARNGDFPKCESPFLVHNLVGNLDEPVLREGVVDPFNQTALKGGWWMPARNRCRPATTAHDAYYRGVQVGARCCADVIDAR